jgi:hypothetical protein
LDFRNSSVIFKTLVYTAHETADVETYAEAEQSYRQSHDGDQVLRFVLQQVAYGNFQIVCNHASNVIKFCRSFIDYTTKTVPEL